MTNFEFKDTFRRHTDACQAGDRGEALRLLRDLQSKSPVEDLESMERLAKAVYNTHNVLLKAGDRTQVEALTGELRSLYQRFPKAATIPSTFARALHNLHLSESKTSETAADMYLSELRDLQASTGDLRCRAFFAKALCNEIGALEKRRETNRVAVLYDEFRELEGRFGNETDVVESLARALFNSDVERRTSNRASAQTPIEDLRDLARRRVEQPKPREYLSKALFNACTEVGKSLNVEAAGALLSELENICSSNANESVLREWYAKSLYNVHRDFVNAEMFEPSEPWLGSLRRLTDTFPNEPVSREMCVIALYNAQFNRRKQKTWTETIARLTEIRSRVAGYPDEPRLREYFAKSIANSYSDSLAHGLDPSPGALLAELRRLAEGTPEDRLVREQLGRVLCRAHREAVLFGRTPWSDRLAKELGDLVGRYPGEPIFGEFLAKTKSHPVGALTLWQRIQKGGVHPARPAQKSTGNNE